MTARMCICWHVSGFLNVWEQQINGWVHECMNLRAYTYMDGQKHTCKHTCVVRVTCTYTHTFVRTYRACPPKPPLHHGHSWLQLRRATLPCCTSRVNWQALSYSQVPAHQYSDNGDAYRPPSHVHENYFALHMLIFLCARVRLFSSLFNQHTVSKLWWVGERAALLQERSSAATDPHCCQVRIWNQWHDELYGVSRTISFLKIHG